MKRDAADAKTENPPNPNAILHFNIFLPSDCIPASNSG